VFQDFLDDLEIQREGEPKQGFAATSTYGINRVAWISASTKLGSARMKVTLDSKR
jgi:hypothetical protein